jgi:putative hydrolase of the HAD superfamily
MSDPAKFAHVNTWVFDLDNTLYPPHCNLFDQVDQRMTSFISELLDLDRTEARALQKDYYKTHGTTLHGLMQVHGVDPHTFLDYVHDIDHSPIEPDPALGSVLAELPGRKLIYTNGSVAHAAAVVNRLGIADHFEETFDIVAAEFEPKPLRGPYERFLSQFDVDPKSSAMFEDLPRNLEVPRALGMVTVLVTGKEKLPDNRSAWEVAGDDASYIDHITDDLADFLADIIAPPNAT